MTLRDADGYTAGHLDVMAAAYDAMAAGAWPGRPEAEYCEEQAQTCRRADQLRQQEQPA